MNPFAFLVRRGRERRASDELLRLDEHLLRDIGLTRSDVLGLRSGKPLRRRDHE